MKKCDHCGAENEDQATQCKECGKNTFKLASRSESTQPKPIALDSDLRRAGYLSDPVKVLSNYLVVASAFILGLYFLPVLISVEAEFWHQSWFLALALALLLFSAAFALPLAMWLVVLPARRKPVFYLRAFRSDTQATHLRRLLRSALGESYRLCGICPPKERVNWVSRLFLTTATGFRYLGTNHFELEASDHNWMVRLLASYSKARFVFVDVRDVTLHVADEIRMSYLAMGRERCIFIVNNSRSDSEWKQFIAGLLDDATATGLDFRLLSYCGEEMKDESAFVRNTADLIQKTPEGLPDIHAALELVHARVPMEKWPTPRLERAGWQFIVAAVIGMGSGLLLPKLVGLYAALVPGGIVAVIVIYFYFRALWRTRKESAFQAKFLDIIGGPNPRKRARNATALTFLWMVIFSLSLLMLPALKAARLKAEKIMCMNSMKQVGLAFRIWSGDHNDRLPFNVSEANGGTLELCDPNSNGIDQNGWRHFQVISNELENTRWLICPSDKTKFAAINFESLQASNVSYVLYSGTNIDESNPEAIVARCPIHGLVLHADGSVEMEMK